jgi:hypothetical protein
MVILAQCVETIAISPEHVRRAVSGTVVDDDDLHRARVRLGEQRIERFAQIEPFSIW